MRAALGRDHLERLDAGIADQLKRHVDAAEALSIVGEELQPRHRRDGDAKFRARHRIGNVGRAAGREPVVDVIKELIKAPAGRELQPIHRLDLNLPEHRDIMLRHAEIDHRRAGLNARGRGCLKRIDDIAAPVAAQQHLHRNLIADRTGPCLADASAGGDAIIVLPALTATKIRIAIERIVADGQRAFEFLIARAAGIICNKVFKLLVAAIGGAVCASAKDAHATSGIETRVATTRDDTIFKSHARMTKQRQHGVTIA